MADVKYHVFDIHPSCASWGCGTCGAVYVRVMAAVMDANTGRVLTHDGDGYYVCCDRKFRFGV